jgi:hypothetical protein
MNDELMFLKSDGGVVVVVEVSVALSAGLQGF